MGQRRRYDVSCRGTHTHFLPVLYLDVRPESGFAENGPPEAPMPPVSVVSLSCRSLS